MPEIPNVVAGEPVESAWGNDIRDRAILKYPDQVALDASQPFPMPGETVWLDVPGHLQYWDGATWVVVMSPGSGDLRYVNLDGDTMTGDLVVPTVEAGGQFIGAQQLVYAANGGSVVLDDIVEEEALQASIPPNPAGAGPGVWLIRLEAQMQAVSVEGGNAASMFLYANGTKWKTVSVNAAQLTGTATWRIPTVVSLLLSLSPGNFIELRAQRNGTGGTITMSNMLLEARRVVPFEL